MYHTINNTLPQPTVKNASHPYNLHPNTMSPSECRVCWGGEGEGRGGEGAEYNEPIRMLMGVGGLSVKSDIQWNC